jgi:hypothetical protein
MVTLAIKLSMSVVEGSLLGAIGHVQGEIASLSLERSPGSSLIVSLFEVPYSQAAVDAFIAREHEFKFVAVRPYTLDATTPEPGIWAVICSRWSDEVGAAPFASSSQVIANAEQDLHGNHNAVSC